jgi:hypothetical protein
MENARFERYRGRILLAAAINTPVRQGGLLWPNRCCCVDQAGIAFDFVDWMWLFSHG